MADRKTSKIDVRATWRGTGSDGKPLTVAADLSGTALTDEQLALVKAAIDAAEARKAVAVPDRSDVDAKLNAKGA